ncbi:MAG: ABC transporter permease [Oscillospiraceae bacterium]|nr:ABC transporter permease [Oscillospiraceae bacterium]
MTQFVSLTKRNLLVYFRDKGAVFFSLLSMFIIIGLMLFFLGDLLTGNITDMLAQLPDHDTTDDQAHAKLFLLAWTVAGIIPINAAMVTLSALSSIIKDRSNGRSSAIHTAPISRMTITLSYIAAACLASLMICSVTLAASEICLCIKGMQPFSAAEHLRLFGMILANSFTYSAMMYLCAMFIKSEGAWSGMGTVIGTLIGFLGGIYMPVGNLSGGLMDIISCTPVIYGTVMFRDIMTRSITDVIFADAPAQMTETMRTVMGVEFSAFGNAVSSANCVMIVLGFGVLFTLIGAAATVLTRQKDR